jgi:hypothetical protein
MKNPMLVAVAVTLLATPAAAQMGKRSPAAEGPKAQQGPKTDDKAYKAALDRIPEPKEKYDPWGGVAPVAAKKSK